MKIIKNKHIKKMLTSLSFFGTSFLIILGFILGSLNEGFDVKSFLIFLGIFAGQAIFWILLYLLLQKISKSYYLVESNSITLYKKGERFATFKREQICDIYYIRFFWGLLIQFGAGYLMIDYTGDDCAVKPDFKYPNGTKLYGISMSTKQAKEISTILGITIPIR